MGQRGQAGSATHRTLLPACEASAARVWRVVQNSRPLPLDAASQLVRELLEVALAVGGGLRGLLGLGREPRRRALGGLLPGGHRRFIHSRRPRAAQQQGVRLRAAGQLAMSLPRTGVSQAWRRGQSRSFRFSVASCTTSTVTEARRPSNRERFSAWSIRNAGWAADGATPDVG